MFRRRRRPLLRTAAVGGVAYAAGHHGGKKSAEQQYTDEQQNAQIADLQQQQAPAYRHQRISNLLHPTGLSTACSTSSTYRFN